MQNDVADRLYDISWKKDFNEDLRGLALTGMGKENLEAVLNSEIEEERGWAIGEALAEAYLIQSHGIIFPWNMKRDKRHPKASLPGADIVGFLPTKTGFILAIGEVKTSSQERCPPTVMSGRSGNMGYQINNLATNLGLIFQILKWLHPRCKGTRYQDAYFQSLTTYLNSGNKAASLFGLLIRDTKPNQLDLEKQGNSLAQNISHPTSCELIALYLSCKISDLPDIIRRGGAS